MEHPARESSPPLKLLDEHLVLKYMAEDEPIKVAVWDLGGQDRFYVLHLLFLSSLGVYIVCFNMEDVLDEQKQHKSFKFIRFWLQSISIHTVGDGNTSAPILLVGTHKDKVSSDVDHRKVHEKLEQELKVI